MAPYRPGPWRQKAPEDGQIYGRGHFTGASEYDRFIRIRHAGDADVGFAIEPYIECRYRTPGGRVHQGILGFSNLFGGRISIDEFLEQPFPEQEQSEGSCKTTEKTHQTRMEKNTGQSRRQ